jgi:predicted ArsR family transcriptional regulator
MAHNFKEMDINLERDGFLRTLLHHLSGVLQDTVGEEDSRGFISIVGQVMGEEINQAYQNAISVNKLSKEDLSAALIDLKRRIQGDFYVIEEDENKIVFGNRRCPFAEKVVGRPSLCMMTSNVFGTIAADSAGYAKVKIDKAIANGDSECKVTVYLNPEDEQCKSVSGREFISESI